MTADHAVAESILRDRRFSSSPVHQRGYRPPAYPAGDPRAELPAADLLTMDPPDHTRIRRLVSGAFTPKAIAGLEPWIREVTGRLLTSATPRRASIIDALAFLLPIAVICTFSVSRPGSGQLRAWGHAGTTLDSAGTVEPVALVGAGPDRTCGTWCQTSRRSRRQLPFRPRGGEEEGDRLSDELVSTALLLVPASRRP
jgi:cytochrome P450